MPRRIGRKKRTNQDVYSAALERARECMNLTDRVVVSCSGGKDSTAVLHVALEAARLEGRKQLEVLFFDEEAIFPETVEYMNRLAERSDIILHWSCVPIKHRNACSRKHVWWYPWHPDEKHLWVRPQPIHGKFSEAYTDTHVITAGSVRGSKVPWLSIPEQVPALFPPEQGSVMMLLGLRTDESFQRYRAVASKTGKGAFMNKGTMTGAGWIKVASPIYDWSDNDVWVAPKKFSWDYNRAYDRMALLGIAIRRQRVCPAFGEEPLWGLYIWRTCWPELWCKMQNRVDGADSAMRYGDTELYGTGKIRGTGLAPKPGETWPDLIKRLTSAWQPREQKHIAKEIKSLILYHARKTSEEIPDSKPHEHSGVSWEKLAKIALRGDAKGRKKAQATLPTDRTEKKYR